MKRLVVVGAGAVGGSIGGLLHLAGLPVVLVARGEHGRAMRERGLSLRLVEGSHRLDVQVCELPGEVDWRDGDVALVSTKLTDAREALDAVKEAAGEGLPIVSAMNGIHGEAWAAERFRDVLAMMVWVPATNLVPGEVRLHSEGCAGVLEAGPFQGERAKQLAEELCSHARRAGFDAAPRDDIMVLKHAKWLTNIGGTAQALVVDDWLAVAEAARAEAATVMDAAGLARISTPDLMERVKGVGVAEVDGQPREGGSTWQSRRRGKPMETPWLEGAMAEMARRLDIPAPVNAYLAKVAQAPRDLYRDEVLASRTGE